MSILTFLTNLILIFVSQNHKISIILRSQNWLCEKIFGLQTYTSSWTAKYVNCEISVFEMVPYGYSLLSLDNIPSESSALWDFMNTLDNNNYHYAFVSQYKHQNSAVYSK